MLTVIVLMTMELTRIGITAVQQKIIDDVFIAGQFDLLTNVILLFAGICLLHIAAHAAGAFCLVPPAKRINKQLSTDLMTFIHRLPIAAFQKQRNAKYVHLLSSDVPNIARFVTTDIPLLVSQVSSILFLIYLIGSANVILLIAMIVISVAYIFLIRYFHPKIQELSKEVQDKKTRVLVTVEEGISSTREVIAFHRLDWEKERYHKNFTGYFDHVMRQGKLVNKQLFLSDPLKWGAILLVLGFGGFLVINEELSVGMFVVIYSFTNQFMSAFQILFEKLMDISTNLGYVERVKQMMEGEQLKDGDSYPDKQIKKISFKSVNFSYGEGLSDVLHDFSLSIPAGKKVAFVGTSGGGKSTLARLLTRFFDPSQGEIVINEGVSLADVKRDEWMQRIAIVFQEPFLFPDTVRKNLTLGRDIDEKRLREICKTVEIDEVFMSLPYGYDTELGERGITLSGGQRQRLALARAILSDSEILILDEATSALDLETERRVMKNIDRLRKGKTTLIIAHRLSTVQNADMIVVMDQGKATEVGTHAELIEQGSVYRRLVSTNTELNKQEPLLVEK